MISRKVKKKMARIKLGYGSRTSPPVLISLGTPDKPKRVGDKYAMTMGSHSPVGCFFNNIGMGEGPCVTLFYPPKSKKYTRIGIGQFENEMIQVISHESVHHALMWLQDDPLGQYYDQIDNLIHSMSDDRRILQP